VTKFACDYDLHDFVKFVVFLDHLEILEFPEFLEIIEFPEFLEILEFPEKTPSGYCYTTELMREIGGITWTSGSEVMVVTCYCPQ
jgi:hypothetical protein